MLGFSKYNGSRTLVRVLADQTGGQGFKFHTAFISIAFLHLKAEHPFTAPQWGASLLMMFKKYSYMCCSGQNRHYQYSSGKKNYDMSLSQRTLLKWALLRSLINKTPKFPSSTYMACQPTDQLEVLIDQNCLLSLSRYVSSLFVSIRNFFVWRVLDANI